MRGCVESGKAKPLFCPRLTKMDTDKGGYNIFDRIWDRSTYQVKLRAFGELYSWPPQVYLAG
jgi:hypothetical protein